MNLFIPLLFISFLFSHNAIAQLQSSSEQDSIKEEVAQAIEKFEQTQRKNWAYQVIRYENEEGDISSSTEFHTPSTDVKKRWRLTEINGKTPTQKQVDKFIKQKVKQENKTSDDSDYSVSLRELINLKSLKLRSEDNQLKFIAFDVYLSKLGDDAKGKLRGTLTYNKAEQYIEKIVIENTAAFTPIFSANISAFKLTFTFTNINDNILPTQHEMDMKGTFAFFTEIDETSSDKFLNYRFKPVSSAL